MPKSILDRSFRYVPAAEQTAEGLKRRFARERRRLAEVKRVQEAADAEAAAKVEPLRRIKGAK